MRDSKFFLFSLAISFIFSACQKNLIPIADFTAEKTIVNVGEPVNFNDLSENDPSSWSWSFDGGIPNHSAIQDPAGILYQAVGSYPVWLSVANANGVDTIIKEQFIVVIDSLLGQPCPGQVQITYGGQVYHTVRIGNQCWLKENLNLGNIIPGDEEPINFDAVLEKYCYADNPDNCLLFGALYQIGEALGPGAGSGIQGICPCDYHIPADSDWYALEVFLDSFCIQSTGWGEHGINCGDQLKVGGLSGFEALYAGSANESGIFFNQGNWAYFWSSTYKGMNNGKKEYWIRAIYKGSAKIYKYTATENLSISVRCVRDL